MNYIFDRKLELDNILQDEYNEILNDDLIELYALLSLVKGIETTCQDVHDAWSIWQSSRNHQHESLVPFYKLSREVKDYDIIYRNAIIKVAEKFNV